MYYLGSVISVHLFGITLTEAYDVGYYLIITNSHLFSEFIDKCIIKNSLLNSQILKQINVIIVESD